MRRELLYLNWQPFLLYEVVSAETTNIAEGRIPIDSMQREIDYAAFSAHSSQPFH